MAVEKEGQIAHNSCPEWVPAWIRFEKKVLALKCRADRDRPAVEPRVIGLSIVTRKPPGCFARLLPHLGLGPSASAACTKCC